MVGKGGKGVSLPKGKTATITPASKSASLKGKDSLSSKKETQVIVDSSDSGSEDSVEEIDGVSSKGGGKTSLETPKSGKGASFESLKSGGKASFKTPAGKGDWGKGGKDGNTRKSGGKEASNAKHATDVELQIELPKNAKVLMDCEAANVLQGIQDYLPSLSDDPNMKIPASFDKALQSAKAGGQYKSPKSVKQVLEKLKLKGVTDGEICMIANICPETTDEVYALITSMKADRLSTEGSIKDALAQLAMLKQTE